MAGRRRGNHPRFSPDGRGLFCTAGTWAGDEGTEGVPVGQLMAMPITLHPTVKLGVPVRVLTDAGTGLEITGFDIGLDGRLILPRRITRGAVDAPRAILVQNWIAAIAR